MPDKIVLHIGSHKTGTTAIQKTLFEQSGALRASGVSYPDIGFFYLGHHHLVDALKSGDTDRFAGLAEAVNALDGTVVLSSENFCSCPTDAVQTLARSLKASSVEIIYYQRNVLELIYLWWMELVKHGNKDILLRFYADSMTRPGRHHLLSPKTILDRWGDAFGESAMKIYLYDSVKDSASHFLGTVLGLHDIAIDPGTVNINKSYDTPAVELMRFLNAAGVRGLMTVRENADGKALLPRMRKLAGPFVSTIPIDFECVLFKRIETELRKHWGARIQNFDGSRNLFSMREAEIRYVDPGFWFSEFEFARDVLNCAKGELAAKTAAAPE